jgi:TolB protein
MKFFAKGGFKALALACATAGLFMAAPARAAGELEVVIDLGKKTIPVRVGADTKEMDALANLAFSAHKAFRRVSGGPAHEIAFAAAGENRCRVTVAKDGRTLLDETAAGASPRNALLSAADRAVRALTGRPGFFASRLAFVGERTGSPEVYVSDLFLGEMLQITNDRAQCLTPRWSPDGRKIIFTSYLKTGFPNIYVLDLAAGRRTTFAAYKGANTGARYNHAGDRVAMILTARGGADVYVCPAAGGPPTQLTRSPNAVEASPCWSPDDSRLLFASDEGGGLQLYLMSASGGARTRLNTAVSGYCAEPDWSSADPNKIAFTIRRGKGFQIAVHDLASKTTQKTLTDAPLDAVNPSWLPDGRHLVHTRRAANTRSLWIWDSETGASTRISSEKLGYSVGEASVWAPAP